MLIKKYEISSREKWQHFLKGEDTGTMVSPLCDDWCLDIPYRWQLDEPEPFPQGHKAHTLSQQVSMAHICGWDPLFLAAIDFMPVDEKARSKVNTTTINNKQRSEYHIDTPYGILSQVTERNEITTGVVKEWLETENDYKKMLWLVRKAMSYDEVMAIEQGLALRKAVGNKGLLGTWVEPPIVFNVNRDDMYYHLTDWPELFSELHELTVALYLKKIDTLHKAGFDYLFYTMYGTEWFSPDFFRTWMLESTRRILGQWRDSGGYVVWHTCGHIAKFIEEGFYNELLPDVFETLSEPPTGNIPSLRWARERLDRRIATKGNVGLEVLLEGTEDDVRKSVDRVRDQTRGYRHIVGLSDDMLGNTPLTNALAFVDEARRT
jgi:hypothetical protein